MPAKIPPRPSEKKETLDDNARKFIVETVTPEFLKENRASSYLLTTDWLETGEDNEKKLAYKKYTNGDIQILLIAKTTKDGNRTSEKEKITVERYTELLGSSVLRIQKRRYEFTYVQNSTVFSVTYDEFTKSKLRILEVDAPSKSERDSFNQDDFPGKLTEVTGDIQYYGYRVAGAL